MVIPEKTIEQTKKLVIDRVKKESKTVSRATDVIAKSMEIAEKVPELKDGKSRSQVVSTILQSPEILNLVPSGIASELKVLLDSGLLESVMTLVSEAAKKHLDINSTADLLKKIKSLFCCTACCCDSSTKEEGK